MDQTANPKFWKKVEKTKSCWLWLGTLSQGYGRFTIGKRKILAHRFAFEQARGPISAGLTLDHLCRNRNCVNPKHLEPVSIQENVRRGEGLATRNRLKTKCPKGHPFSAENTYRKNGWRYCRTCRREASRVSLRSD